VLTVEDIRRRLIVALDFPDLAAAEKCVKTLGDAVTHYKVGMELYYAAGPRVIEYLREQGKEIFLDLKMHDIPNTVTSGAAVLTRLGVSMFNIHAVGGPKMMAQTAEIVTRTAKEAGLARPKVIALTVLTSMDTAEWDSLGYVRSIPQQVLHFAQLAKDSGIDGVVASPLEALAIRAGCGADFLIVTPGVRPAGAQVNDQSRISTPSEALRAGSDFLVIGRPVTGAADPRKAAEAIVKEMRER